MSLLPSLQHIERIEEEGAVERGFGFLSRPGIQVGEPRLGDPDGRLTVSVGPKLSGGVPEGQVCLAGAPVHGLLEEIVDILDVTEGHVSPGLSSEYPRVVRVQFPFPLCLFQLSTVIPQRVEGLGEVNPILWHRPRPRCVGIHPFGEDFNGFSWPIHAEGFEAPGPDPLRMPDIAFLHGQIGALPVPIQRGPGPLGLSQLSLQQPVGEWFYALQD